MPDLTSDLSVRLKDHQLPGLNLGDDFVFAKYDDQSILNIPPSVCRLLGVPEFGTGVLNEDILAGVGGGFRKVILILVDALALHRLQRWMADGTAPVWNHLIEDGLLAPLTSITPSTTSAALTSLWTGESAAVHGIAGYEMWLKEYGMVTNTIMHTPMAFKGDADGLTRAGFDPVRFLNLPTLGEHLSNHGVNSYAFQHASIINSGLSKMFFNQVDRRAFTSAADLWVNVRDLVENRADERLYAYVYWPVVDTLSHRYGPDDERTAAEFASFSDAFEHLFLEPLRSDARKDTLVILTADHGCITTRPDPYYDLRSHPNLARRLHINPTGEHRLFYLHVRPGQIEAVCEYIARKWPNQFQVVESAYAVEKGLFGPGEPHPGLLDRLGELIVIARGDAYLWWEIKKNFLIGRHGGLHAEEMLVPFLAAEI